MAIHSEVLKTLGYDELEDFDGRFFGSQAASYTMELSEAAEEALEGKWFAPEVRRFFSCRGATRRRRRRDGEEDVRPLLPFLLPAQPPPGD